VAYSVRQRLHEMGIRIALVASYGDILALVVGKGVQLAIIDVALGTPAAFAASRALGSLLYGISPHDLTVFISVPVVLIVVTLAASHLPARRAARVDPMSALCHE
jgi:putative ABC transport system permease protein